MSNVVAGTIPRCNPSFSPLTQFTEVANVTYPSVYQCFLDGVDVLNFNLTWILSTTCILDVDFHDTLLLLTVGPLIALLFLGITYTVAARKNRGSPALGDVRHRHLSVVLLLTFLVYSSVSATLFRSFACEELDDGKNYLRADYRIECDSPRHAADQVYAGFMILLYPVGIPVFYAALLFRNRSVFIDKVGREQDFSVKTTTDLWKPYKPDRFYYEVVECGRRILLAGVVVFIYPNTAAQIAITLIMAVFFVFVSEILNPYASMWDAWVSRLGHAIVFASFFLALLLKVDVSNERAGSQRVFEAILVCGHVCMIVVVIVEALAIACSLNGRQTRELRPMSCGNGALSPSEREAPAYTFNGLEEEGVEHR